MAAERFALRASRPVDPRSTTWFKKEPADRIGRRACAGVWIGVTSLYPHARRAKTVSGVGHDIANTTGDVPEQASNARSKAKTRTSPANAIATKRHKKSRERTLIGKALGARSARPPSYPSTLHPQPSTLNYFTAEARNWNSHPRRRRRPLPRRPSAARPSGPRATAACCRPRSALARSPCPASDCRCRSP